MSGDAGLTCPRCGAPCPELTGSVSVDGTESIVRVPVSCPGCTAPLSLVVRQTTDGGSDATPGTTRRRSPTSDEPTSDPGARNGTPDAPDRIGVELWLEDRREDDENGPIGQ